MKEDYRLFVGIDWGPEHHHGWVTDATGAGIGDHRVCALGGRSPEFADWIVELAHGQVDEVAIACEMPHGAVVDGFLERGCHVFALNPKQLDRFRDRFSVGGAKDDPRDAEVLSSALRTDRRAFRRLTLDDALTIQLRELSRQDTELGEDLRRLTEPAAGSLAPDVAGAAAGGPGRGRTVAVDRPQTRPDTG